MTFLPKIFLTTFIFSLILGPNLVLAQGANYTLLEPQIITDGTGDSPDFATYAKNAYQIFLIVVVFLTVLMFIVGGLEYMASSIPAVKAEGLSRIKAATWGLILALSSFLILNIINPELLKVDLNFARVGQNIQTPTTGGPDPVSNPDPDNRGGGPPVDPGNGEIRNQLINDYSINVSKSECPPGVPYQDVPGGCTSVEGLQPHTLRGIKHIRDEAGSNITITGGSELGHASGAQSHGTGYKIDLGQNSNSSQWSNITTILTEATGEQSFSYNTNYSGTLSNGQRIVVRRENPEHYDIKFLD